ncbi:MAG: hypothetical protein ABJE95_21705, partial [Byssovorax sp.]
MILRRPRELIAWPRGEAGPRARSARWQRFIAEAAHAWSGSAGFEASLEVARRQVAFCTLSCVFVVKS